MPTIVHFDIPADNIQRAKAFYEEVFGWNIKQVPGSHYYFIETVHLDGEAGVGGALALREKGAHGINYIGVRSIGEYIAKAVKNGGKVIQPKTAVAGWGYLAVCVDTEGNTFGLWQKDRNAKEEPLSADEG